MTTWWDYIRKLPPSKMAHFFRTVLAHNQGCPPANLMHVLTVCEEVGSCDECWWIWLASERVSSKDDKSITREVLRCWDCRWGARGNAGQGYVICMNPRFYGVTMNPEDFCSDSAPRYKGAEETTAEDIESAMRLSMREGSNDDLVDREIRMRYERKQKRKIDRSEKKLTGGENEKACEHQDDRRPTPDPWQGQDRAGHGRRLDRHRKER